MTNNQHSRNNTIFNYQSNALSTPRFPQIKTNKTVNACVPNVCCKSEELLKTIFEEENFERDRSVNNQMHIDN